MSNHNNAIHRRADAAHRLPPLPCGCTDPWLCPCDNEPAEPSQRTVDAYAAALRHLQAAGLAGAPLVPELRAMWRRGGDARRMVEDVAGGWVVTQ